MKALCSALLLLVVAGARAEKDLTLCPELIKSGFLPSLADRWIIEFKLSTWKGAGVEGAKSHEDGYEAFDAVNKKSGYVYTVDGDTSKTYQVISDYDNDKSYLIHLHVHYTDPDACRVRNASVNTLPSVPGTKTGETPIGPMQVMYLSGTPEMPGPIAAKELPSDSTTTYRQMRTVNFLGCQYFPETKQTIKIIWYYVNPAGTKFFSPVGAVVNISVPNDDLTRTYTSLRYDFMAYEPSEQTFFQLEEETKIFEVPKLYSCKMDPPKAFPAPNLANMKVISYSVEYITYDPVRNWMKQQAENYNYHRSLYKERDNWHVNGSLYPLNRVSDYSTGVRHTINRYLGTCHLNSLNTFHDTVAQVYNDGVCLRSPAQLFGTDLKYTYDGLKNLRGIECHTWTADMLKPDKSVAERLQWCFAANTTYSCDCPNDPVIPVLLILAYDRGDEFVVLHQEIFSFEPSEPPLYVYDVSECFRSTTDAAYAMRHFVMQFPSSVATLANNDPIAFKVEFIRTVKNVTTLSDNRITNVRIENSDTTDVTFSLLPPAPVDGGLSSTSCPPKPAVSIDTAAATIAQAVSAGSFTVKFRVRHTNETFGTATAVASTTSFYEVPRRTPQAWFIGYSSGAMIGVGLAAAFVGFTLGVVLYISAIAPLLQKKMMS